MKRILIALLVLLFALTCRGEAGSTKLSIEIKDNSVVLGEPLLIEVKMESTGVFSLAREFGPCDGGLLRIVVKNTSGIKTSTATDLPPCPSVLPPPSDVPVVYPSYQDQANFTYKYWLMPGDYEVQASYHSENNTPNETAPFWTGMLYSNSVRCHVDYPKGDDLQALLALGIDPSKETSPKIYVSVIRDHSLELLKKHPSSTYAGYELYDHFPTLANAKLDVIENQEKALQNWCDRGQSQEKLLKRKQETLAELDSYANQVKKFLGCHPNFLYGNSLRKRLAVCLGLNGRVAEAMEQVELLSKEEGKEAEEAREFLECIEGKKKMETAPVEKSVPKAADMN